jgi:hypothetical protein
MKTNHAKLEGQEVSSGKVFEKKKSLPETNLYRSAYSI